MKNLLQLVVLALGFGFGCKKEDKGPALITNPCLIDSTFTTHSQYPLIYQPVVNPNNPDEFLFIKNTFSTLCCKKGLMIYNMATKEIRQVYEGAVDSPDWSKNDWIIFKNYQDYKIYKIKSNGDSLIQLIGPGQIRSPKWNIDGSKFIYNSYEGGIISAHICSENGTPLQTFESNRTINYDTWHHDSLLASAENYYPSDGHVHIIVFSPLEIGDGLNHRKAIIEDGAFGSGCDWIDNETLLVTTSNGIYKVNFSNPLQGTVSTLLVESCNSRLYKNPAVVRQTQQVILERYDYEITGEKEAIRTTRFIRMNLDGSSEEVIEIPGL